MIAVFAVETMSAWIVQGFFGSAVDAGCGCGEPGPSGCDNVCGSTAVDLGCGCGEPGPSGCDNVCGSMAMDYGCGCGEPGPSGCDNVCGSTAIDLGCGCGRRSEWLRQCLRFHRC